MTGKPGALLGWLAVATLAWAVVGCGPPQVTPQNQLLTSSLRTAISARKTDWLEANAKVLAERREAGQVSDTELETFQAIIDKAKAGQWEEAERDVLALQKAQRPTQEQIDRVTRRETRKR